MYGKIKVLFNLREQEHSKASGSMQKNDDLIGLQRSKNG